jgi:hypothetical protein
MVHEPGVPYRVTFCLRCSARAVPASAIPMGVTS